MLSFRKTKPFSLVAIITFSAKRLRISKKNCNFGAVKRILLLVLVCSMANVVYGSYLADADSLVLNRMFSYRERFVNVSTGDFTTNVYVKHLYRTQRRNATLWVVPSMYAIARGERSFVSEQYGRFTFHNGVDDYDQQSQVYYTTIPRQRRTMPVLLEFVTPNLYDATLYSDHVLSPFCRENRVFYKYRTNALAAGQVRVYYRPRFVNNTQLVTGQAIIDGATGRILQAELNGEFDMIRFRTLTMQGHEGLRSLLPQLCQTNVEFRFMGNHITSHFEAVFDCPITLPDTLSVKGNRQLIDSIRPLSLSADEQAIYDYYDSLRAKPAKVVDSLKQTTDEEEKPRRRNYLKEVGWDLIGENLVRSLRTQSENGYVRLSPIINPQYISYSHRKGVSYKLKLGARYRFSEQTELQFNPTIGYNFKLNEFYFKVPLRLDYSRRLDAHVGIEWGNDNRIGNSSVLDEIRNEQGDLPELANRNLDLFDDNHMRITHSIAPLSWLSVETGLVYHKRRAVNAVDMERYGKPVEYRSLAPTISLKLRPWKKAPVFSIDYERGLKSKDVNLVYERWEIDASQKYKMRRMQTFNVRVGGGFYTNRGHNYFMDFANFRDQNLPEGWDDDWTGNFQLLSSRLYNQSDYYLRGNLSYESPLLLASMTPFLGRYVERERAYLSSLLIDNMRPYSELGYSFTCRYFSMGVFASFLALKHQEVGCKFTFELFRRW